MEKYLIKEYNKRWLRSACYIALWVIISSLLLCLGVVSVVFSNSFGGKFQGLFFIAMSLFLFYGCYSTFSDGYKQYRQQEDYFWNNYVAVAADLEKSCTTYQEHSSTVLVSPNYIVLLTKEVISDIYFIERAQVKSITVRDVSIGPTKSRVSGFSVAFKLPVEIDRAIVTFRSPVLVKDVIFQLSKPDLLIFNHSKNKFDLVPKFKGNHLIY